MRAVAAPVKLATVVRGLVLIRETTGAEGAEGLSDVDGEGD